MEKEGSGEAVLLLGWRSLVWVEAGSAIQLPLKAQGHQDGHTCQVPGYDHDHPMQPVSPGLGPRAAHQPRSPTRPAVWWFSGPRLASSPLAHVRLAHFVGVGWTSVTSYSEPEGFWCFSCSPGSGTLICKGPPGSMLED